MSHTTAPITEASLNLDLNEQAHSFARELAMACRKMSIYGSGHPLAVKAVEKPFFLLSTFFRHKRIVNLNVQNGLLYLLNIRLKDSVFNGQILQILQTLDVNAVLFHRGVDVSQFSCFVESAVTRELAHESSAGLASHLKEKNVTGVEINTERAFDLFENRKQYRGDVDGDFSVRRLALNQMGNDLALLSKMDEVTDDWLFDHGIDFDAAIVQYLLPEKIASLPADRIRTQLMELAARLNAADSATPETDEMSSVYMTLFKLVGSHPGRDDILAKLEASAGPARRASDLDVDTGTKTGAIKIQSQEKIETHIEKIFASGSRALEIAEFCDSFGRLLKTGLQPQAQRVMWDLLKFMSAADPEYREKALNLTGAIVEQIPSDVGLGVIKASVDAVLSALEAKNETYEYSEFIWKLFQACHRGDLYEQMARLTKGMADRRMVNENVTVYDSMAVKKAFENISRPDVIQQLITELVGSHADRNGFLKETLINIGTEDVAFGLARIISHPIRTVRQLTLKILAELGKSSLKVFSRVLNDDNMFKREEDRRELPDERWYVVRNSIFVLGSIHDEHGVSALRIRMTDTDFRVRREIVCALEKIGGEDAIDCLTVMAEDSTKEIREAAIIAIGLLGDSGHSPLMIDLARRMPAECVRAVTALGKLGGDEAKAFLGELLADAGKLAALANGQVSRDDLKIAVVKALGEIGDDEAIKRIKQFQDTQSGAAKLLFKNSQVNRVISEVLSRH